MKANVWQSWWSRRKVITRWEEDSSNLCKTLEASLPFVHNCGGDQSWLYLLERQGGPDERAGSRGARY